MVFLNNVTIINYLHNNNDQLYGNDKKFMKIKNK